MHRVGARPGRGGRRWPSAVAADPELRLEGLWTHFAVADEPDIPVHGRAAGPLRSRVADAGPVRASAPAMLHAANSAGALFHPAARLDMVRCGVALYGLAPAADLAGAAPRDRLRPALSLRARVSFVKEVDAGERLSYGLRYRVPVRSVVATVPLGYADGVTRQLVGHRRPGPHRRPPLPDRRHRHHGPDPGRLRPRADVAVGDVAVLLGRQGAEEITAWEWARAHRHHRLRGGVRGERPGAARLRGRALMANWRRRAGVGAGVAGGVAGGLAVQHAVARRQQGVPERADLSQLEPAVGQLEHDIVASDGGSVHVVEMDGSDRRSTSRRCC